MGKNKNMPNSIFDLDHIIRIADEEIYVPLYDTYTEKKDYIRYKNQIVVQKAAPNYTLLVLENNDFKNPKFADIINHNTLVKIQNKITFSDIKLLEDYIKKCSDRDFHAKGISL